ncbi:MAG: enoyl-CoA hydratase-related protein [Acidimicrobiales bacterium]|nr:enoyl-CoA hydratase/isomerase family protein [Acidimicrobiales bacterium]
MQPTLELKTTRYEVSGGIATLTLSRPHRHNAWTGRMHTEYRHLLACADADPEVRVVVVTGEGRAFCVGGDSQALDGHAERGSYDPGTAPEIDNPGYGVRPQFDTDFAFQFGLTTPVIAAVNGAAAGVGLAVVVYADLRFAASGAKLTTAHGKLGLPAEYGLSWMLPRLIGHTRANDLLLSSRKVTTDEVADWGLFNRVVAAEDLMDVVYQYASTMVAEVAPSSIRTTKRQIALDLLRDVGASVDDAGRLLNDMMGQPDYREGVAALIEKRPPRWPPQPR